MEYLFRGYVNTSYSQLKRLYGNPVIENGKASWNVTVKDKLFIIYDYIPLESSNLYHKWRVDSEYKDLSDLEELLNTC